MRPLLDDPVFREILDAVGPREAPTLDNAKG
jgi:hypothetical protein